MKNTYKDNFKRIPAVILIFALVFGVLPLAASSVIQDEPLFLGSPVVSRTAKAGDTFDFNISFFNNSWHNSGPASLHVTLDGYAPFTLIQGSTSIGNARLNNIYSYKFLVPEDIPSGTYYIQYSATYSYENFAEETISQTANFYGTVTVTGGVQQQPESGRLRIENISSDDVAVGAETYLKVDIFNSGTTDFRDVVVQVLSGNTVLTQRFIGMLPAQGAQGTELTIPAFRYAGNLNLTVNVNFTDNDLHRNAQRAFSLRVNGFPELEISEITLPTRVETDVMTPIAFTLVNRGEVDFKNVQAYLLKDNIELKNTFIGSAHAQSSATGTINHVFTDKTGGYSLRVIYEDPLGVRREVRKAVTPAFEGMLVVGSGQLRIQNITPPVEELILTPSFVEFWLTNPTRTPILGAEAFLYNDRGTQLSSIYISGVGENSSDRFELPFITGRTAGVYSYTLEIKYRDADGKPNEITRTFSVNVVTEKTDVEEGERPARIIIQRINNPAIMYLGVNTRVPYTIVNAGKGGAYNVEVYVVDAEGNELAREYVGNIPPAGSSVEEVEIKFDIESEHELTMYAIYENFNESRNQVTRSFTQRVIAYRASVTDVAGFEWLEVGMQTNIEFSILNNGSEVLRNTTAVLSDSEGNRYGELFIGTIEPGTIKERLRFRNIMFWEAGGLDLMITVTYENESMQTFSFETNFSTMVSEPWTPDFGDDWGDTWPEDDWGMEVDGEGGEAWWVLWLILGGLAVAGVVVLVVFVKKGARKRENDEMENFIKAMSGGDVQPIPEPAATHEYAYSVEASNNDEE